MFCDNPECMTYYKKKFSGGGGSGGSSGGANAVKYKFGMPADEVGLAKVSDLTPSYEELRNGWVVDHNHGFIHPDYGTVIDTTDGFRLDTSRHIASFMDGLVVIGKDVASDENPIWHFMVIGNDEVGEMMGQSFGGTLEKGIYFCGTITGLVNRINELSGYEAYLIWDKK